MNCNGYSMVRIVARATVTGTASDRVTINFEGAVEITGGRQQEVLKSTPVEWCDYYGAQVTDGVALLYKAVDKDYMSSRGGNYAPGTTPSVPVFKAEPECAAGALYFSPTPRHTHEFVTHPGRYVACPVRLEDIVTHPYGQYPAKVKAIGCCAPVYEVDIDGVPVPQPVETA
jgi:hypothetical protein